MRYKSNTFATDRSATISFTVTDPCPDKQVKISDYQTFFPANGKPLLYKLGEKKITFNITGGYVQDDISIASGVNNFCGEPTFRYIVKSYSDS